MPVDEIDGFTGDGIGEVLLFMDWLAASDDRVVGIVVGLVAQVGRIDHLAEGSPAFSSTRQNAPA
jgi:hypothetical protein